MPSNVTIQINKYDIERLNIKAVTDILDSFIPELLERNRNRGERPPICVK